MRICDSFLFARRRQLCLRATEPFYPEFRTANSSSSSVVTTNSGLQEVQDGNLKIGYNVPSTRTADRGGATNVPVHLQFHFEQASFFLERLVRLSAEVRLPGLPRIAPTLPR